MADQEGPREWLSIDTRLTTSAGVVALLGTLLWGIACLMGASAFLNAVRHWVNQQERPPSESAKLMLRQVHDAALASTTAATEAWRNNLAPPKAS